MSHQPTIPYIASAIPSGYLTTTTTTSSMMASRPLQLNTPIELAVPSGASDSGASTPTDDYFSIRPKLSVTISNDINSTHYPMYRVPFHSASTANLSSPPEYSSAEYEADEDDDDSANGAPFTPFTPFTPMTPALVDAKESSSAAYFNSHIDLNMDMSLIKRAPCHTAYDFLLVDDNAINLRILERVLNKLYPASRVTKVQDSTKVQPIIARQTFDMVFLDIEMPSVTGVDLARHMRSQRQYDAWGIVAVTTRNTPSDIEVYRSAGIDHTFPKPLTNCHEQMMDTVNWILKSRKARSTDR